MWANLIINFECSYVTKTKKLKIKEQRCEVSDIEKRKQTKLN